MFSEGNDHASKIDSQHCIEISKNKSGGGTTSSSRLGYIDALKGFAILCVVLGHVADGYISAGMYSEHFSLNVIHDVIYSFHMALFMLISGYVFYMAYFDEHDVVKERRVQRQVMNLLITYISFDIAFGLFKVYLRRFTNMETSVLDVLLFPIQPIPPYWYIYLLIPFYIIFSRKLVHRNWKAILLLVAIICLISSFINTTVFELHRFLYYLFYFALGICYRKGSVPWFGNSRTDKSYIVACRSTVLWGISYPSSVYPSCVPILPYQPSSLRQFNLCGFAIFHGLLRCIVRGFMDNVAYKAVEKICFIKKKKKAKETYIHEI